jgi:hypothetical protein
MLTEVVASAADCKGDFIVSSQQDADTQLAGCDTIVGSIIIGGNYSGPLIISNINEYHRGYHGAIYLRTNWTPPRPTELDFAPGG